jgi:transcriptional regulator with XRE-family HTH domain
MARNANQIASAARINELIKREPGHSDAGLGKELGVSRACIGDWRKGVTKPTGKNLTAFAERFGVSEAYVLGLEESTPGDSSSVALALAAVARAQAELARVVEILEGPGLVHSLPMPGVPFGRMEGRSTENIDVVDHGST